MGLVKPIRPGQVFSEEEERRDDRWFLFQIISIITITVVGVVFMLLATFNVI